MKTLFIADKPYIIYRTLIKAVANKSDQYDIILLNHIDGYSKFIEEVEKSQLFSNVYYVEDTYYKELSSAMEFSNNKFIFSIPIKYLSYQRKSKNIKLPNSLNLKAYDRIYANTGLSCMHFILYNRKIPFIISEHFKNQFSTKARIPANKGVTFLLNYFFAPGIKLLDKLGICYAFNGLSKYCVALEVNNKKEASRVIKDKELLEWDIDAAISKLSEAEKDIIFNIYKEAYGIKMDCKQEYNLLLTNPLFTDGFVETEAMQLTVYKNMVKDQFEEDIPLIIKPHPRDKVDYKMIFPNAYIIDSNISSEILNFSRHLKYNKALTLYSTSISSFKEKSNKAICLEKNFSDARTMEWLQKYMK